MEKGGTKHTGVPVKTLKKLLKKAGLKVSGKKATLTRRAKKARLFGGGLNMGQMLGKHGVLPPDKQAVYNENKARADEAAEKAARQKRVEELSTKLYNAAIAELPTKPSDKGYNLNKLNDEFLKKYNLFISEPKTQDEEVLTKYAKAQSELADAFNYMLKNTDYLKKQDFQNRANSEAHNIIENRKIGFTESNSGKGFVQTAFDSFRGGGKKKRSRRS